MEGSPDPYDVLGVAHDASQAQIVAAYRAALIRHHPDTRHRRRVVIRDDVEDGELQQVLAAYAVVGDPGRRAVHDRSRPAASGQPVPVRVRHHAAERAAIVAGPVHWWPRR